MRKFLLSHECFAPSEEVANLLIHRYDVPDPADVTRNELLDFHSTVIPKSTSMNLIHIYIHIYIYLYVSSVNHSEVQ